ncbi:MAG: Crp/Fnr family transcriptional regulator [Acidimicrobiales bacterium]
MSRLFVGRGLASEADPLRHAAWVARCVGRDRLSPLGSGDLEALAEYLQPVAFERGATVFRSDSPASAVWMLQTGRIGLYFGPAGSQVILAVMQPGDVDGDLGLLLGMAPPYTAQTLEASTCLRLGADAFNRILDLHPAVSRRWLTSVASRLVASQRRLTELLGISLSQQVARVLLDEASDGTVPYAQATIAALLGARRPSVNKVLNGFQRSGAVAIDYRSITILDRMLLHAEAGRPETRSNPGRK